MKNVLLVIKVFYDRNVLNLPNKEFKKKSILLIFRSLSLTNLIIDI